MQLKLSGKVAVITGSTTGIGRACAERFAAEGARVVVSDEGNVEMGQAVVESMRIQGGEAVYQPADVRDRAALAALIECAVQTYGRLDILMNNAVTGKSAAIVEQDEAEWDSLFASSIKAVFLGAKFAIPHMIQEGGGTIVNVASVHGLLGGRQNAAYNAAKGAIVNLTRQMAVDYGHYNIRVNALCPGRILTERKLTWLDTRPDEQRRQHIVYPLRRPGTLDEIAKAALFLASDDSSFVTGHALVVDGGLTAQLQDALGAHVEETLLAELHDIP